MGRFVCGPAAVAGLIAAIAPAASAQPVPVTPNPQLTVKCGLKVMLVLDESASISAPDVVATRAAADAFVDGLQDTCSEVAIVGFAASARNLVTPYQEVTAASLPTFTQAINTKFVSGLTTTQRSGTNWQGAFNLVHADDVSGAPDLVVFVTDGNPNIPATTVGDTATQWNQAIGPAITAADSVKAQGSRIFAMGVGSAVSSATSQDRLKWISDASEYPEDPDFTTADYTLVSDFDHLKSALSSVVAGLCGSSVIINKWVSHEHGGPWIREPGWRFTTTLDTGHTHTWLDPASAGTSDSATLTTDSDGGASFLWRLANADSHATVSVTRETEKPGYRFVFASCLLHTLGPDGTLIETVHPIGGSTTEIPGAVLGREEFLTCDVYNAPPRPGGGGGQESGGEEAGVPKEDDHLASHLVVSKEMPAHAHVGERVPITITVHNIGEGAAHDVFVHETAPEGAHVVAAEDGGSIGSDDDVLWHVGDLAPGEKRAVHATLLLTHAGRILNTAVAAPGVTVDEPSAGGDPAFASVAETVRPARRPPPRRAPPRFTG